jgi:hypothetical protein
VLARAQQHLDDRQREAGGLAGTGLGRAHDVTALQQHRDGLGLDRRRVLVALLVQGAQDERRQAEIGETDLAELRRRPAREWTGW